MFPKENRLRTEKDIQALFAGGKSVFGMFVGIKIKKNLKEQSRFTVVVGTKISKKAVVRNRLKRQIRAIVHAKLCELSSGYDVAFLVKKEAVGKNFEELQSDVEKLLRKAKLLT
jgi:ribonuclease P protein component